MKKKSITQKSKIDIPPEIDVAQPVSPATFARICGVNKSSISHGIKNGLIVRRDDGKIDLADNSRYLSQRFSSELARMDAEQSTRLQSIIAEIIGAIGIPRTATPEATEVLKPRPYVPELLEIEKEYSLFIRERNVFRKIAVLYIPEDSGMSLHVIEPFIFETDERGRLEAVFADQDTRLDLYFSESTQ